MKKILLPVLVLCLGMTSVYGQKGNLSKAKTRVYTEEAPDYQGAKTLIEEALVHPETANDAKTWYTAGEVFNEIAQGETNKQSWGQPYDAKLREECIIQILPCLIKADSLDQLPNAKGKIKPKYTKKIKNLLLSLYKNSPATIIYSAENSYNNKDFAIAAEIFDMYVKIPNLSYLKEENLMEIDTTYNDIKFNTALTFFYAENVDKAAQYFKELTTSNYKDLNTVYRYLLDIYLNFTKDTVNYVSTLETAVEKFSDTNDFLMDLINFYVNNNEHQKATIYLNKAIEIDPENDHNYLLLGFVYENLKSLDKAEELYNKALSLNPNNYYANIFEGQLIYNKAVALEEKSFEIKDNKELEKINVQINTLLRDALKYYEKALELKPNDIDIIRTLKSMYYKLKMQDKYNDMEQRLNAM